MPRQRGAPVGRAAAVRRSARTGAQWWVWLQGVAVAKNRCKRSGGAGIGGGNGGAVAQQGVGCS